MVHLPVTCCKLKYFQILDSVSVDSCSNHSGCPVAEFKVLLIGEHGVGKTALLLRHLTGEFFQGGEAAKSRLATWQRKWKGIKLSTFFVSSLIVRYVQNLYLMSGWILLTVRNSL